MINRQRQPLAHIIAAGKARIHVTAGSSLAILSLLTLRALRPGKSPGTIHDAGSQPGKQPEARQAHPGCSQEGLTVQIGSLLDALVDHGLHLLRSFSRAEHLVEK